MCGGDYKDQFEIPKPFLEVNGEKLIERTIRLLKENGIKDIGISTNNPEYEYLGIEILKHKNQYIHDARTELKKSENSWLNAYYPTEEPACYLAGDIYWSDNAIKTIIETPVKDTMFFCSRDINDGKPTGINIKGREPFAYKVENQKVFRNAINELFEMIDSGCFTADPISWNLYRKINNLPLDYHGFGNDIFNTDGDYVIIEDYTTDIDSKRDIPKLEKLINILKGGLDMVKVEVIADFHLDRFNELHDIVRKSQNNNGYLYVGDTFICEDDMAKYLLNEKGHENPAHRVFVKAIEVIPAKVEQTEEPAPKKTRRKRTTNID